MKDKEPTSVKAITQATHPYPTTPHPTSQSSKSRPKYFLPDVLQEDNLESVMDLIPYQPDPPSPTSPPSPQSPPDTPTPGDHINCVHPLRPDLLVYKEFNVKVHTPSANDTHETGLTSSIHAPSNVSGDQLMNNLLSPTATHTPMPEEQAILVHLVLTDMNQSVLSHNGMSQSTALPQFTPALTSGFPIIHMLHSAQIFDHLDNRVLLAWFQVEHPKFMVQVFNHSGKGVAEQAAIIAEHICTTITTIVESIHHTTPVCISPPQPQDEGPNPASMHMVHN
ncbi:uncharacterized protein BJ212DRAFT_1478084 [Suillus subaureus]|uniref:Uncharacterized protein n=1 Tax=Suillus subaureus TaxID=48587 RepID=A0A9P7EG90_9AGAM|nr:uncharacterized protein BJ212DRAFT_1478084 [Suillus subaureus]KAG1820986.1 hypothetical protein BJ212DRAFT_1478084 [Suillus subaureus]